MKLFAYGALMSPTHLKYINVSPLSRETAMLEGYELRFEKIQSHNPYYGAANIRKTLSLSKVFGVVYDITDEDLAIIDEREEYPTGYTRENITVQLLSGETIDAITYIAHPEMIAENLLPTKEYISLITESVDILPEEYIQLLNEIETLPEHLNINNLIEDNNKEV